MQAPTQYFLAPPSVHTVPEDDTKETFKPTISWWVENFYPVRRGFIQQPRRARAKFTIPPIHKRLPRFRDLPEKPNTKDINWKGMNEFPLWQGNKSKKNPLLDSINYAYNDFDILQNAVRAAEAHGPLHIVFDMETIYDVISKTKACKLPGEISLFWTTMVPEIGTNSITFIIRRETTLTEYRGSEAEKQDD